MITSRGTYSSKITMGIVAAVALTFLSCAKKADSSSSTDALGVSGILSLGNSSQSVVAEKLGMHFTTKSMLVTEESVSAMSVDLTQYVVKCATATAPVKTGSGVVNSDGSFSISIEGGTNQPLSCYLVDGSGTRAADFLISDSSKKDLNGANQVSGTAAFSKDAALGTITFDPNSGEVTVPSTNIAGSVAASAPVSTVVFDPTGAWTINAVDFTMPSGVKAPCTGGGGSGGGNNCNGPPEGQSIYMKLWKGTQTSDNSDVYGLQLWQSSAQYASCGSKIGLTPAIKASLGIDFSANGASDNVFSFSTSVANFHDTIASTTGTVNLTSNWKMDTAKAQWDINPSCGPHDITIAGVTYSNAWTCGPDSSSQYQIQLGGGCVVTSTNAPVQLNDWSSITCGATSTAASGIKTMTCTGNASINSVSTAVTCTNKWAVTNSSYVVQAGANFNWNDLNASKIASGTLCSAMGTGSESAKIAQLQCYANYYQQSGFENASGACLPKVDMDWSATTSAAFAVVDKIRPSGLVFFEQFKPFADGSGGTMVTRQEHYDGVQVNGNSWVNCRVIETGGLTVKKISDTKMIATYQSSTVTTSLTKPACMAKFSGARETFLFYLNK